MDGIFTPQNIKIVSDTISLTKKRERHETILEPLQTVIQLALLSFCPVGTKINLRNNLLQLQLPGITQGLVRWFNNDNKDDLFYLFYACKRFPHFYMNLRDMSIGEESFYDVLVSLAKQGLDKLSKTYSSVDKIALLHTLEIYKALLDTSDRVKFEDDREKQSIDNIFVNIKSLYSMEQLQMIFNTLIQMRNDPDNYLDYLNGLNAVMAPVTRGISGWIHNNVVF